MTCTSHYKWWNIPLVPLNIDRHFDDTFSSCKILEDSVGTTSAHLYLSLCLNTFVDHMVYSSANRKNFAHNNEECTMTFL